ncbi:Branched-chain-amino-acid aminotransferase, partial [Aduncisulcus paluster]
QIPDGSTVVVDVRGREIECEVVKPPFVDVNVGLPSMNPLPEFTRQLNPSPASPARRAEVLAAPGFGKYFTDHMVSIDWNAENGWHNAQVMPYGPITLDPSAIVLHYAQELPQDLFIESLRQLIAVDADWVPPGGGEESLYLRPFIIATEAGLGVRPADEYRYLLIASPAGAYFSKGIKPVSVWLSHEYVRAAPGGIGAAKTGGNYAASLVAQAQAADEGCDQVVWLDAIERRYIEEMGGMKLFFVFGRDGEARLVTPELSGSLLPGVTRKSLLQLASDAGFAIEE